MLAPHHRLEGLPNWWLVEQPAGEEFESIEIKCDAFQHSFAGEAVVITATENERVPNVFQAPPVLQQGEQPEDVSIMAAREPFIGPDCQPFVAPGDYGADVAEQGTKRARLLKIPHEIGAARELKDFIAAVSR